MEKKTIVRGPALNTPYALQKMSAAGLPADLLQGASTRLGVAALLYAACYLIAYTAGWWASNSIWLDNVPQVLGWPLSHLVAGLSILLSLGIFFLSRVTSFSPQTLCDLGLWFEVVGAVGIDFALTWYPIPPEMVPFGISWVGPWILVFVLLVPSTPGKTVVTALATASVTPLLLLVGMARGTADPSLPALVQFILPNYLCAGLAFAGARVIYELGSGVSEARRMGEYQLVERLGTGGMGEVWSATHRMLVRPAAIKLIRPEVVGGSTPGEASTILQRFEREAQATAALCSAHTITLYDFGVTEDGLFYYVMELLNGFDLESMVKRFGPIPPDRTIFLLQQVCHSLADAHAHGMIHRDIKPANIYVSRLGLDYDFVKVLDFGLVKSHREDSEALTQLTGRGVATGTPAFMAPEMAVGEQDVDGRADIYSLGCVAYWMLTGQLVFETKNPVEMVIQHIQEAPVPPSQRSEFQVPDDLEKVLLSCLEKDREKRPADAMSLSSALEACAAQDPWSQRNAERWWRTNLPDLAASPLSPSHRASV